MGSSTTPTATPVTPAFARLFRAHADVSGAMTFAQFMQLALYDPTLGYYARPQPRVGYGPGTDFFTASTSGPIFGELIVAACVELLGHETPKITTSSNSAPKHQRASSIRWHIPSRVPAPFNSARPSH